MKKNPVVHFEMPAVDQKRVVKFYSDVFGWQCNVMGADMGNYIVVQTGETDKKGMPQKPGFINGGFYSKSQSDYHYPSVVIAVDDIKAAMKNVEKAGGKVLGKPMAIPNVGSFVSFIDTEGNRVSILQPRR